MICPTCPAAAMTCPCAGRPRGGPYSLCIRRRIFTSQRPQDCTAENEQERPCAQLTVPNTSSMLSASSSWASNLHTRVRNTQTR